MDGVLHLTSASVLLDRRRMRLNMETIEANKCLRSIYKASSTSSYGDRELSDLYGAPIARSSRHETLTEQAAQRLAASQAAEVENYTQNNRTEALDEVQIAPEAFFESSLQDSERGTSFQMEIDIFNAEVASCFFVSTTIPSKSCALLVLICIYISSHRKISPSVIVVEC